MNTRVYVLLDAAASKSADIVRCLQGEPGVVAADLIEGPPDVLLIMEASDRERLAELTVRALTRIEAWTQDLKLLPTVVPSVSYLPEP